LSILLRSLTHGQQRLRAIQCLDLRFVVNAEHNCLIARVEVKPDDVSHLLDNEGIFGDLIAVSLLRSATFSGGGAARRRPAASGGGDRAT
jgi:hypothetical protein